MESWVTVLLRQVVALYWGLAWSLLPEEFFLAPSFCLVWRVVCFHLLQLSSLGLASSVAAFVTGTGFICSDVL